MIRKKTLRLALVLFTVLLLGLAVLPVSAQPPEPEPGEHYFYGPVTIGGFAADDGTSVSAHIGSLSWATTTTDGKYGYDPAFFYIPADDPETPAKDGGEDGDVITFKVLGTFVRTWNFTADWNTELPLTLGAVENQLTGLTCEVNCDPLDGVTIELFKDSVSKGSTTSAGGGIYGLSVAETGEYEVVASKTGFTNETQTINIVAGVNTLDFIGETGLIPDEPDIFYVLGCIDNWLYPPSEECELSLFRVLDVVDAWQFPE